MRTRTARGSCTCSRSPGGDAIGEDEDEDDEDDDDDNVPGGLMNLKQRDAYGTSGF